MLRKFLFGLGLAFVLGLSFVPATAATGCEVCQQVLQRPIVKEYTGTLHCAPIIDRADPLRPSRWSLKIANDTFNLLFSSPELEKQATKLVGKKVKITARLVISGLQVIKIEAA